MKAEFVNNPFNGIGFTYQTNNWASAQLLTLIVMRLSINSKFLDARHSLLLVAFHQHFYIRHQFHKKIKTNILHFSKALNDK